MNSTFAKTRESLFLCPSDTVPNWSMDITIRAYSATAPGNNYFASVGSSLEFAATQSRGAPNGVFAYLGSIAQPFWVNAAPISLADITDGTSSTIAFGEWRIGTGDRNVVAPRTDLVFLGVYPPGVTRNSPSMLMDTGGAAFQQWVARCNSAVTTGRAKYTPTVGMGWAFGLPSFTIGNTLLSPNATVSNCSVSTVDQSALFAPGMWTLNSAHPKGANVVMVDGSVRFLSSTIDRRIVWGLGSRAQGEVLDDGGF